MNPPKFTNPQAKLIRTLEGIIVVLFNLAIIIATVLPNTLTPQQSLKYATIFNSIVFVSRQGLKCILAIGKYDPQIALPADTITTTETKVVVK